MTRPGDHASDDSSAVLRAIGSLLVALSGNTGDEAATTQRLLVTLDESALDRRRGRDDDQRGDTPRDEVPAPAEEPRQPAPPPSAPRSTSNRSTSNRSDDDEIEFILQDARDRAQQILDESTERARELLKQARTSDITALDRETVDELRQSMYELMTEIRDVQQRLGRIEALIATDRSLRNASRDAAPREAASRDREQIPTAFPTPSEPARDVTARSAREPERQPERTAPPPIAHAPPPSAPEPGDPAPLEEPERRTIAPPAVPAPAPAPPRSFTVVENGSDRAPQQDERAQSEAFPPPSAIPRLRYAAPTVVQSAASDAGASDDQDIVDDDAAYDAPPTATGDSSAPIATFLPGDGAISLRVTPVSGFQGLMRIQDALSRLPAIRQAAVEAYSQGEARLRIELADSTDSEELATGLGRALRTEATVHEASEDARQLLIALA